MTTLCPTEPGQPVSRDEERRLAALRRYDVLDTPPEEVFDRITRLAARLMSAPMAAVVFMDERRQWFKSRVGLTGTELKRGPHFCAFTLFAPRALVVADATSDPRFRDNPLVSGPPGIRAYAGVPLRTAEGHSLGTLCVMDFKPRDFGAADIEALADLAALVLTGLELRLHAMTDALTGVLSRRAFRDEAGRLFARAQRRDEPLSCLVADIDHFKSVNDTLGHAAGDLVLRGCAQRWRARARADDRLGRIGGEEFAWLLPQTGLLQAHALAEELRIACKSRSVPGPGGPIPVTASFGIATLDGSVRDPDTLLARADQALYRAKRAGRDRSVAWEPAAAAGGEASFPPGPASRAA